MTRLARKPTLTTILGGLRDEKALERFSTLVGKADLVEVSSQLDTANTESPVDPRWFIYTRVPRSTMKWTRHYQEPHNGAQGPTWASSEG